MLMMNEELVVMVTDEIVTVTMDWEYEEKVFAVRALLKDPEIGGVLTGCEKLEIARRVRLAWSGHQR